MNTPKTDGAWIPVPEEQPSLFDAHCHLQDERLARDLDAVMERAVAAGVTACMCCGTCESDWDEIRMLARRFPGIRISFGLHPWHASHRTKDWLESLRALLREYPAAVGEIGLDHALGKETFEDQEQVFLTQLSLAAELRRPVSVHCRRAWGRMLELLDHRGWPPNGILFHSYSGGPELVTPLVRRGAFFSFSGAITHEKNVRGRAAVPVVPADRIVAETDAPDLMPCLADKHPDRFRLPHSDINEPAHLVHVVEAIATLRNWTPVQAAAVTTGNAERFFALPCT